MVLKLHGAIDRGDLKRDSYVITEDSYIDYLVGGDVGEQIPVVAARADGRQPLPLPRLLDARLEPARDPQAESGATQQLDHEVVGRAARRRMMLARARSRKRSGGTAATSTSCTSRLRTYATRLKRQLFPPGPV